MQEERGEASIKGCSLSPPLFKSYSDRPVGTTRCRCSTPAFLEKKYIHRNSISFLISKEGWTDDANGIIGTHRRCVLHIKQSILIDAIGSQDIVLDWSHFIYGNFVCHRRTNGLLRRSIMSTVSVCVIRHLTCKFYQYKNHTIIF